MLLYPNSCYTCHSGTFALWTPPVYEDGDTLPILSPQHLQRLDCVDFPLQPFANITNWKICINPGWWPLHAGVVIKKSLNGYYFAHFRNGDFDSCGQKFHKQIAGGTCRMYSRYSSSRTARARSRRNSMSRSVDCRLTPICCLRSSIRCDAWSKPPLLSACHSQPSYCRDRGDCRPARRRCRTDGSWSPTGSRPRTAGSFDDADELTIRDEGEGSEVRPSSSELRDGWSRCVDIITRGRIWRRIDAPLHDVARRW